MKEKILTTTATSIGHRYRWQRELRVRSVLLFHKILTSINSIKLVDFWFIKKANWEIDD